MASVRSSAMMLVALLILGAPVASAIASVSMPGSPALFRSHLLSAQTDFYNLDKERPLRVEDAYTTKRWAFEIQGSPLTLSQDRDGDLVYAPSIELKHGLLGGMEVSAGVSMVTARRNGETETSTGDLELSSLLNLWLEGERLPAAGFRVTGHLPLDSDESSYVELRGILTRSLTGRFRGHLNGAVVAGSNRDETMWAGLAIDHVLPFHHTLLLLEGWVASPEEGRATIHSSAGTRVQLSPTVVLDGGVGRSWSGERGQDWSVTFGVTHEFGVRSIMPGGS
jgi:hypothetical protein